MWILGVNYTSHDSSAALIYNGKIIAAAEEERFNREKHTKKFPEHAIKYCLKEARIQFRDIEKIAFFNNPRLYSNLILYNIIQGFPKSVLYIPYGFKLLRQHQEMKNIFKKKFPEMHLPHIDYVNHHLAHAASTFYPSPFENSAILTFDGRGEYETLTISIGRGTSIKKIYSKKFPHSIGYLYSAITKYLGFRPQSDEYIVMGLSSYGKPSLVDRFSSVAFSNNAGVFKLNLNFFDHHFRYGEKRQMITKKFIDTFGAPRVLNSKITQRHADIAFALQRLTEKIILDFVEFTQKITAEDNLCIAGGVALNCMANAKVIESKIFKNVFIQPAANDAGTSLGAGLYSYFHSYPERKRFSFKNIYLGPSYSDVEIKASIEKTRNAINYVRLEFPAKVAAELIYTNKIVGWFQGRMEFGPRALGNRSILATPSNIKIRDLINEKIKFREDFRPFAPAILAEHASEFFNISPVGKCVYPFMLATVKVKSNVSNLIPAVLHVDNTARIQIVEKQNNPLFWELINEYYKLSGLPLILNTSFNVKGEPIVCSVEDALHTFQNSGLDFVIINNYLISKVVIPKEYRELEQSN